MAKMRSSGESRRGESSARSRNATRQFFVDSLSPLYPVVDKNTSEQITLVVVSAIASRSGTYGVDRTPSTFLLLQSCGGHGHGIRARHAEAVRRAAATPQPPAPGSGRAPARRRRPG